MRTSHAVDLIAYRVQIVIIQVISLAGCVSEAIKECEIAHFAIWEVLFNSKHDNIEAKVELKTSSLRARLVRVEKIVTAHLRHSYREGRQHTLATGDYEIHCAARVAYRSNLSMDVTAVDRSKSSVSASKREMLSGNAHSDMVSLMDVLCNK